MPWIFLFQLLFSQFLFLKTESWLQMRLLWSWTSLESTDLPSRQRISPTQLKGESSREFVGKFEDSLKALEMDPGQSIAKESICCPCEPSYQLFASFSKSDAQAPVSTSKSGLSSGLFGSRVLLVEAESLARLYQTYPGELQALFLLHPLRLSVLQTSRKDLIHSPAAFLEFGFLLEAHQMISEGLS